MNTARTNNHHNINNKNSSNHHLINNMTYAERTGNVYNSRRERYVAIAAHHQQQLQQPPNNHHHHHHLQSVAQHPHQLYAPSSHYNHQHQLHLQPQQPPQHNHQYHPPHHSPPTHHQPYYQSHDQKPLYEYRHYNYNYNINQCNYNNYYKKQPYSGSTDVGDFAAPAYTEYPDEKPIKMQREEIIIEHSQLVLNGNVGPANEAGVHQPQHHHRSHHYTQIIAALAVSLGPLAAGLGKGYSSPAIASLQELQKLQLRQRGNYTAFTVTDQQASWVASLSLLGALFGGMFGGLAMQYGRRRLLTIMSLPFSLSWILTVFAKSVETMFVTAFLGGFCCAIVSMVTQVYISEISSPDIRGFLSAIQKIAGHLGIMISFSLGAYLDWRQLAMLVSVAPMMLFVTVIYIPETPSFLVLKGRDEEAYRSLQWLRGPHKNVELELETIKSNIRAMQQNRGRFSTITTTNFMTKASMQTVLKNVKSLMQNTRLLRPVLITCGLMVFQRFTGANSFGFYAVNIFSQTFAGMNPHGGAIAVSFVQLLASMLSGLLIDTVGRIPLLIVSSVFMSLALASFGSFAYYNQANKLSATADFDVDAASSVNSDWMPLLCVLVFTIAFSLGISPISSLLVGELFPLEYRGIGSSIATSFSYFCAFLSVKTYVDFKESLGLHGAFWLYACISCVGLFFVVMFVPETKGKDLDEMDPRYVRTMTINR